MFQSRVSPTVNTLTNVVKLNDSSLRVSNPNFEYGQNNVSSPMAAGRITKNRSQSGLCGKDDSPSKIKLTSPNNMKLE